jgi:hypothetical protein
MTDLLDNYRRYSEKARAELQAEFEKYSTIIAIIVTAGARR